MNMKKFYVTGDQGAKQPVKVRTLRLYGNLEELIQKFHIDYINSCAERTSRRVKSVTFEDYLNGWETPNIYELELGQDVPPKKLTGKKILEILKEKNVNYL